MSKFPFPFKPYDTQSLLMENIYECIDSSSVGVFESPTGTGKSLSIICSAAHWLRIQERNILEAIEPKSSSSVIKNSKKEPQKDDGLDWLSAITSKSDNKKSHGSSSNSSSSQKAALDKYKNMQRRVAVSAEILQQQQQQSVNSEGNQEQPRSQNREIISIFQLGSNNNNTNNRKGSNVSNNTSKKDEKIVRNSLDENDNNDSYKLEVEEIEEYGLDEYHSDSEASTSQKKRQNDKVMKALLGDGLDSDSDGDSDDDESGLRGLEMPQILYCSRTHTQVAQFVSEIKKTSFKDMRCISLGSRRNLCIHPDLQKLYSDTAMNERCLEMQKNKVSSKAAQKKREKNEKNAQPNIGSNTSEKKKRSKKDKASTAICEYHMRADESQYGYTALNTIRDIEDLAVLGKVTHTCAYYGSRRAVNRAQIVCMPYNILMQPEAREAVGLGKLDNKVIILDEAHNIVDAVNAINSCELTLCHLNVAIRGITEYCDRFQAVIGGRNLYYLNLLVRLLQGIEKAAKRLVISQDSNNSSNDTDNVKIFTVNEFMFQAQVDNLNIFKLRKHILASNLERRIGGYCDYKRSREELAATTIAISSSLSDKNESKEGYSKPGNNHNNHQDYEGKDKERDSGSKMHTTNALRACVALTACLRNADADGRIVLSYASSSSSSKTQSIASTTTSTDHKNLILRFVLLNPASHFQKVVAEARSVLLLGGTMRPFDLLVNSLVPSLAKDKLRTFSCSHVVDKSHVLCLTLGCGPKEEPLDFRFNMRSHTTTITELYLCLQGAAQRVSYGKVVFFTSYSYMEMVIKTWTQLGLLDKLKSMMPVLVEPRGGGGVSMDKIWQSYCKHANTFCHQETTNVDDTIRSTSVSYACNGSGAMLFCVMGGKMSEGINFSDNLARLVVVVGLPFPDSRDPVLAERMQHADMMQPGSSKALYEGICMRSVNQSIGRSIRHHKDYAAIMLLDTRYRSAQITSQLPGWIAESTIRCGDGDIGRGGWTEATSQLTRFFNRHQSKMR